MIVTHEQDKMADHAFLLESYSQLWRRVSMELAIPYFILTYEVEDHSHWVAQTELYWQVTQLLACCTELVKDNHYRLVQIALISPSWMNGQTGWQMDTIAEIWRASEEPAGVVEMHYVTPDGKRYTDRPHETSTRSLVKIFSMESSVLGLAQRPA